MNLQFGEYVLDVQVEKSELQDLHNSSITKLSVELLRAIKDEALRDLRDAISAGNITEASKLNGYLSCVEDFEKLFSVHLEVAIKDQ